MFQEDLSPFLAQFGVPCVAGARQFLGLLDQPDEIMQMQRGAPVQTREYELTCLTLDAAALSRDMPISVSGVPYAVRSAPRQIDDGAFSAVLLTRA